MALQNIRLEKSITEASRKIVLTAGLIAVLFPLLRLLKTSFIENKETNELDIKLYVNETPDKPALPGPTCIL